MTIIQHLHIDNSYNYSDFLPLTEAAATATFHFCNPFFWLLLEFLGIFPHFSRLTVQPLIYASFQSHQIHFK